MPNKGVPRPRWRPEEDDVIRKLYPDTDACEEGLAKLGNPRSKAMISKRARALGVAARNAPWSDEENEIMASTYPSKGLEATKAALAEAGYERTSSSITSHAKNANIRRDESKMDGRWTNEEIAVVRKLYESCTATEVSERLAQLGYDRTPFAVAARARLLGMERKPIRRKERKGELKVVNFVLDTELDRDVMDALSASRNRSDYIRRLVRQDIASR